MPPYILFPRKQIPKRYVCMWFANHSLANLPAARPVVLLVGKTEAHIDLHTFEIAWRNGIYFHALLKNATNFVQPADVGLFGPMKQAWYMSVRRFTQKNLNTDITKRNFCSVFKFTWEDVMRPSILSTSFWKSGIYPLRRQQIIDDQIRPSLVYNTCSTTESQSAYGEFASLSLSLQSVFSHSISDPSARKVHSLCHLKVKLRLSIQRPNLCLPIVRL